MVVVAGSHGRKRIAPGRAAGDVVPHALAQPVVVVAGVVDGQQSPVLGVEHEQQPVEEHQRRLADIGEIVIAGVGQGLREARKGALEHHPRKVLRDLPLVAPAFRQRALQKSVSRARPPDEGVAAEQQVERAQVVFGAGLEGTGEIDLVVAGGAGTGALVVETP